MKIFLGSDHNGYQLRTKINKLLISNGYDVVDEGDKSPDPKDDFPVFASKVVRDMLASDENEPMGILICGSGQGMAMAANRFRGIRASVVWDLEEARSSRNDDDSNVLCLPARLIDENHALNIVETWLKTPFAGATRFNRRINELDRLG
ncbi:MAG: RpiB/LacA/LacB family sugar-phosphate isomerase [bacterium]|jgi:ribose 5-phosphate isomerase B